MTARGRMPERDVIKLWHRLLLVGADLTTEDGEVVRVVYPGRTNDSRGADFRDAVIATRRGLLKGDIEVHMKSGDWRSHRHHTDPAYDRVVLHVVMHNNRNVTTAGSSRIIALEKYAKGIAAQLAEPVAGGLPCLKAGDYLGREAAAGLLERAGDERFQTRAHGFLLDFALREPGECLYSGIMGALGYSSNKIPFLELARRVPFSLLAAASRGAASDEECLARQQSLLLGNAGFLPSQRSIFSLGSERGTPWIALLERIWAETGQTDVMKAGDWQLFRVRPGNFPVRRIVAVSCLATCYKQNGLHQGLICRVRETESPGLLADGLVVTASGYWADHFDFGPGSRIEIATLIGRSRAAEIIINVLLPFAYAWGKVSSDSGLMARALGIYRRSPGLAGNSVERHMLGQLGLGREVITSARRQQGLLHIYKAYCTQGRCGYCPFKIGW